MSSMKTYKNFLFLSVLFLFCLSVKARDLILERAIFSINQHNQMTPEEDKIVSKESYRKNHRQISGLPSDPLRAYGSLGWVDMQFHIIQWRVEDAGFPVINRVLIDGEPRYLNPREAVSAINEHNRTAPEENKIVSEKSYGENYRLVSGLHPHYRQAYHGVWTSMRLKIADWKSRVQLGVHNKVLIDGELRYLNPQEAASAINKHNRTTRIIWDRIVSEKSYSENYRLVSGLPSNLRAGYGYIGLKEIKSQVVGWEVNLNYMGNKILVDEEWRFLNRQKAISAINEHNQTASEENKIVSEKSYSKNYKLVPGLPSSLKKSYGHKEAEEMKSQIIGWEDNDGNKILIDGKRRFLNQQKAISAINEHNRTAPEGEKMVSDRSYNENYRLVPGLPNGLDYFHHKEEITSQIIGWENNDGNIIVIDGKRRFLNRQEAISTINEHNRTAPKEDKIVSSQSYQKNHGKIPGLHTKPWTIYGYIGWAEMRFRIIGWKGYMPKNTIEGEQRYLTPREAILAINEHNRTAPEEDKIVSEESYRKNHEQIPGLFPLKERQPSQLMWRPEDRFTWEDFSLHIAEWEEGRKHNKVLIDGELRYFTPQEAVSAVNEHNRTAPEEKKIFSSMSYRENYKEVPGLHWQPWNLYGLKTWTEEMLPQIVKSCSRLFE